MGCQLQVIPDSKVHGANVGPTSGRQNPGGPHIGPMNFAIWDINPDKTGQHYISNMVNQHTVDDLLDQPCLYLTSMECRNDNNFMMNQGSISLSS